MFIMPRALQFPILFLLLQWSSGDHDNHSEQPKKYLLNKTLETNISVSPNIMNGTNEGEVMESFGGLKCLSCLAYTSDALFNYCMNSVKTSFEYCVPGQQCFTEFHPLYVKRGCIEHGKINKKFYCNCHLCNDKPSNDIDFYEYETIRDWTYDNDRLRRPTKNGDKLCKTCHTGRDAVNDSICLDGKYAAFMTCQHDQVCYTNINDITGLVTRGCANAPVFNSIRFNCNKTDCNNRNLIYFIQSQNKVLPSMYTDDISSKPKDIVGSVPIEGRRKMRKRSKIKWGKGVRKKKRWSRLPRRRYNNTSSEKLTLYLLTESVTILLWTFVF